MKCYDYHNIVETNRTQCKNIANQHYGKSIERKKDRHSVKFFRIFWNLFLLWFCWFFLKKIALKKKILYTCTIMHHNRYRVTKLNLYTILFHTIWTKNLFMSTWFTKVKNIRSFWNCTSVQKKMKISKIITKYVYSVYTLVLSLDWLLDMGSSYISMQLFMGIVKKIITLWLWK